MDILSVKKNYLRYVHYYFWNKYCNLPFLAIYRYQFPLLIFLASSWSKSENCTVNELANKKNLVNKKTYKRKNNYHFKGLYKTTSYKTKSNFSQFFFSHWLLYDCFFFFSYKSVYKFWKIDKISMARSHCIEKWRKFERNISTKFSPSANHGGRHRAPPFSNLWIRPW